MRSIYINKTTDYLLFFLIYVKTTQPLLFFSFLFSFTFFEALDTLECGQVPQCV